MIKFYFANVGIQSKPSGFFGFAKTLGRNGITVITTGDVNNIRWNFNEIGFFDPMYDNKFVNTGLAIKHVGKPTYFRNVHLFIGRIKKKINPIDFVRVNLWK